MAELRNWQPGWIDRARHTAQGMLAPLFGGDERAAMAYVDDKVKPTLEYMPGVGDAMAAAEARDEFAKGNYGMGGLLAAGAMAGLVPGVGDAVQKGVKKGIRAYHGSPYDFDKFSLDKIGTGEGAQAYGHGLYFAENEGVARGYRDVLAARKHGPAEMHVDGKYLKDFVDEIAPEMRKAAKVTFIENYRNHGSVDAAADYVADLFPQFRDGEGRAQLEALREKVKTAGYAPNRGRMYEVNINADPNDFLDWDKPYSEQPEAVRRLADQYNLARSSSGLKENTGANIYRDIGVRSANPADEAFTNRRMSGADYAAAPVLKEAGIPGIKYLDAGSRSAGDGSRNYVVFDDALIEILRKYGLAGMGLLGAGMMYDNGQEEQVY